MATTTTTRQSSFICSFAQTDDDLLMPPLPTTTTTQQATTTTTTMKPTTVVDCDMVDLAEPPAAQAPAIDDLGDATPRICVAGEEDAGNISDGSSLYHTFDEVYELEAKVWEERRPAVH